MSRQLSLIKSIPLTRKGQAAFIHDIVRNATEGDIDVLKLETYLKALEVIASSIRKDMYFKEAVQAELDKSPGREVRVGSAIVTEMSRSTYDYSDDPIWSELNKKRKEREKMLKSIPSPIADPETGEIINPAPKKVSHYLKVEFDESDI